MKLTYLLYTVILTALTSCNFSTTSVEGEGPIKEENRTIIDFNEIEINGAIDVIFEQSKDYSVIVKTNENLLEYIITELDGAKLLVKTKDDTNISSNDNIKVFVKGPEMNSIILNGSGSFVAKNHVKVDDINCDISGSGNIEFGDLVCNTYSMNISGSGDIILSNGKSKSGDFAISGSGDISASNWKTKILEIAINGSGSVEAFALKQLDISISGSGDVTYKGEPKENFEISGSGDIEKM